MNPITICPSTLAEGYDSYSPIAIKHLFDGRQVSPFLDYTPIDDDNNSAAQEEFLHNQERISDRKSTRLNSSHKVQSRMPSSA